MRRNIERRGLGPRRKRWCLGAACAAAASALLGCGVGRGPYPGVPDFVDASSIPVYKGPVAAPQVAYRIDENRYFEIVPLEAGACTVGRIYYNDKAKGIRSLVMSLKELGGVDLVIDAANEQYLVAPMTRGSVNCSSGGGFCGGPKLPYSIDGGRTWMRGEGRSASDEVHIQGSVVHAIGNIPRMVDLANGKPSLNDWKYEGGYELSMIRRSLDTKFHCSANGKE